VALLRLVSPGAVTDGVTYFPKKTDDLFSSQKIFRLSLGCHPHPLNDVTRGGPPPSSDATGSASDLPYFLVVTLKSDDLLQVQSRIKLATYF